ncbi:MAG: single-stranded-DNA-specific exonuclease RecJ [Patescibacteria group bacterium]|nr:single-stranded-DNA-specific exonuclease RecJ [Patescibacteria group bacterium]
MNWKIKKKLKFKKTADREKEIIDALLSNRGFSSGDEKEFLSPTHPSKILIDSLFSEKEINKAISRIKKAIKNKEKIIVYGDYDTDGICATAIIWETLASLGADVIPFIPSREDGYGLKNEKIKEFSKKGVNLIITVDQGIVHRLQVDFAKKKKIDVIITDHHEKDKELPKAFAVIHTTKLAGAGVAWFLSREILRAFKLERGEDYLLDLAVVGTITDMVPLLYVNRSIAAHGIKALNSSERKGLGFLYQRAGIDKNKIKAWEIGFLIGPRINASGRMSDPMDALRLLCTIDSKRAGVLADKLDKDNKERQVLTKQTVDHARKLWLKEDEKSSLIFIYDKSYSHGVIGLAASRIKDEFYKPAVILAPRKDYWVASARSIEEFNIIDAIRECSGLIKDHGGHKLAAGFSVSSEKLGQVKEKLLKISEKALSEVDLIPTIDVDMEINLSDLSFDLMEKLLLLEPFGVSNLKPVFLLKNLSILDVKRVGADASHLKLVFSDTGLGKSISGIYFSGAFKLAEIDIDKLADVVFNPTINEFNGKRSLELLVKDIRTNED